MPLKSWHQWWYPISVHSTITQIRAGASVPYQPCAACPWWQHVTSGCGRQRSPVTHQTGCGQLRLHTVPAGNLQELRQDRMAGGSQGEGWRGGWDGEREMTGTGHPHVNGLVQDCSSSSVLALELLQSCTEPCMCHDGKYCCGMCGLMNSLVTIIDVWFSKLFYWVMSWVILVNLCSV